MADGACLLWCVQPWSASLFAVYLLCKYAAIACHVCASKADPATYDTSLQLPPPHAYKYLVLASTIVLYHRQYSCFL